MANKEHIQLWVNELRSGKYSQGRNVLSTIRTDGQPDEFCCLGVACETAIAFGANLEKHVENETVWYGPEKMVLPPVVSAWLGLDDEPNPPLLAERSCDCGGNDADCDFDDELSATAANDDRLLSFEEIADLIEKRYLQEQP